MRSTLMIAANAALVFTIGALCGCQMNSTSNDSVKGSGWTGGSTAGVSIANYAFDPNPLSFPHSAGVTITWTNNQSGVTHTVTFDSNSGVTFDSGDIAPGMTASFDASGLAPGSYGYHCKIHTDMTGTITITNN